MAALFVTAFLGGPMVAHSQVVFAQIQKATEKKANAAKENPGQKKGLEKCAKLTDATKKQACIAQQAQARKEFGKSKGKAKKDK